MPCKYGVKPNSKRCIKPLSREEHYKAKRIKHKVVGTKRIKIKDITEGDSLWRYERTDEGAVVLKGRGMTTYEKGVIEQLKKLPNIDVADRGSNYELLDGAHRLMAHSQIGRKTVTAKIHIYYEE